MILYFYLFDILIFYFLNIELVRGKHCRLSGNFEASTKKIIGTHFKNKQGEIVRLPIRGLPIGRGGSSPSPP